ncbi:EcsC family protein [Chlorogloeopsis sp. ULAP01]|uniref:EcsC family protein n=1 Tax=Chlorogloeopsis sp. ULAP01 TaxID=3056483 RepID=UPI0025AB1D47|nr:EcsC family protein [Chlorogloeopsis sp. ULAP01]MDM9385101.1 EcsC family protein [Chlorogloeopsis sp. ULAP01]
MADKPQKEKENKKLNNKPPAEQKEDKPSLFESFAETLGCVAGTAVGVGAAASSSAIEASKAVAETAAGVGEAAAKQTHKLIEQATHTAGQVTDYLGQNWLIRRVAGVLNLNWLVGASDNVDLEKAAAAVKKLQQEHPNESPSQIAHRIMVEKATKAGGIGFASSLLPGFAAALLAIDLAATTQLQSEMIYQIAAAYGLDLKDPARRGEVLAIFGIGLGGGKLLRAAGLGLLRNVPFAGAVIGASSNSTMVYSLGYAACRFYEAKLDESKSLNSEETITELKEQSDRYLETAIAQQKIMDQILVHMLLASYPDKTWETILPELEALNLTPESLDAIKQNIKSPQPLDDLLNQLNRDFAVPLLAQCCRIAKLEGEISPPEQKVIDAIATKFDIDLNSIKSIVNSQ